LVVSGPAASGKTVLAQALSVELRWPLISKDEIKSALMEVRTPKTSEDAAAVGRTAMATLLRLAANTRSGAVLDAVWREGQGRYELRDLPGDVIEVFCSCPLSVMRARYAARSRPERYVSEHRRAEDLWSPETMVPLSGGWPVVDVDTTGLVDFCALLKRISDLFRDRARRGGS
jgi:predicted kinase